MLSRMAGLLTIVTSCIPAAALCAPLPGAPSGWPARPQAADSGRLAVMQFVTTDPQALMREWRKATPGVKVRGVHTVRMGQPATAFLIFRHCEADANGTCHVSAEWRLLDPQGRLLLEAHSKVRDGLGPLGPGAIGLATDAPTITFAPPDRPGRYRLRARTSDAVSGITLETEDVLTVTG